MKKFLLLGLTLLLISGNASAQAPWGYIGLYADNIHTTWCTEDVSITMYVWCLPGPNGFHGAEFACTYPSSGITKNPMEFNTSIYALHMGDLESGIQLIIDPCQNDWCWIIRQGIIVTNPSTPFEIAVVQHPAWPPGTGIMFTSCEEGFPIYEGRAFTNLLGNTPPDDPACVKGTHTRSWGAIKSLYE